MKLTGGMIIMNKQSDQRQNPNTHHSRGRRKAIRRRRTRFCFLCICVAAITTLLCLPAFLNRNVPGTGTSEPSSFLQNDLPDSLIRIVNPAKRQKMDNAGGTTISPGTTDADSAHTGNSDNASQTGGNSDTAASASGSGPPWYLLLVNRTHPLPDGYQDQLELTELDNGQSVDSRIYPALQSMFDAMREDGVYPIVASGFRTTEKQQSLMDEKIASFESQGYSADRAKKEAETWVAIPGTSEHQLGSAVDINADGIHSAGYQVYEWLDKHAHEYGFIHRYPDDKTEITGISNEPWHYRYVGEEAAAEIHRRGICLEEYLDAVSAAP